MWHAGVLPRGTAQRRRGRPAPGGSRPRRPSPASGPKSGCSRTVLDSASTSHLPLRRTDGPQSGGHGEVHGGPQSGGHDGPQSGGHQTKRDKRKAKKARQKAKRRAAKAESAATKPSSPPVSPPDSLSSPPPRTDVQEMKPPSGEARHATAPQPNNPKTLTPRRPVGGEALIQKTPTRAAAATPAAAATADGEEDEECGAGVGW